MNQESGTLNNNLVCIIEDNKAISKLFSTILKKAGYQPFEFFTGNSALEWLRSNNPKLVICDILLPDINGTELLKDIKTIKESHKWTIIAVTGFAHSYDRDKFIEIGFDAYFAKPINATTFISDIKQAVQEKESNN